MVYPMSDVQQDFDKTVWRIVSAIPSGCVMSYGEVARAAGRPRYARMVSKAMSRSVEPLPWYRVVRSNRTLAFAVGSEPYKKQQGLLEKEGVIFVRGKVIPVDSDNNITLDELLWGPPK